MSRIAAAIVLSLVVGSICDAGEWVASPKGAKVWSDTPMTNETVHWSGEKDADGFATGKGLLVWLVSGIPTQASSVVLEGGKPKDTGVFIDSKGNLVAVNFDNGKPSPLDISIKPPKADGAGVRVPLRTSKDPGDNKPRIAGTAWDWAKTTGTGIRSFSKVTFDSDGKTFHESRHLDPKVAPATNWFFKGTYSVADDGIISATATDEDGKKTRMTFQLQGSVLKQISLEGNEQNRAYEPTTR